MKSNTVGRMRFWLQQTLHPRRRRQCMDEELQFHLEQAEAAYRAQGLTAAEAHRRARIDFGSLDATREESNRQRPGWWLATVLQDLRYGWRLLRKDPSFTLVAAGSLALAIGANTAIFSLARTAVFERLHLARPTELRIVGWSAGKDSVVQSYWSSFNARAAGMTSECFSYPIFRELEVHNRTLAGLAAYKQLEMTAVVGGVGQKVTAEIVSGGYYDLAQIRPQLGRLLTRADEQQKAAVVVLSDSFWRSRFGGSPSVLGQSIRVNGLALTVIGVNPRGFTGLQTVEASPEIFVPLALRQQLHPLAIHPESEREEAGGQWWLEVAARVRPGAEQDAQAEFDANLTAAVRAWMDVRPGQTMPRVVLADGSRGLHQLGDAMDGPLPILGGLALLVFLLASANIANLQLARGEARLREMGMRLALGAGRLRILRQILTESLLLASLGGAGGLLLGFFCRNLLPALLTEASAPAAQHIRASFDGTVFLFALAATFVAALLFGLVPALRSSRSQAAALKESASTATRRQRALGAKAMIAAQIALSTLLVIAAGLFVRTVLGLNSVDTGFKTDHLLLAEIDLPQLRYPAGRDIATHQRLEQRLAAVPGVESVAGMAYPWLAGMFTVDTVATDSEVAAHPLEKVSDYDSWESLFADESETQVGADFFQTLGVPIVDGRGFTSHDTASAAQVAVVNRALALKRFGTVNVVGRHIKSGRITRNDWVEIVGLAADTRTRDLREQPAPQLFIPYAQRPNVRDLTYAIRTRQQPETIIPALRRAVAEIDPDLALADVRTQREQMDETMRSEHLLALLATGFGVLALLLAAVGIYGVMAYAVERRTSEIGLRLALGARREQVLRKILGESAWMAAAGCAAGLAAALGLARLMRSILYGVRPDDPLTYAGGALLLLAVALAATFLPARRAASIEPMTALRHE
jgi:predicted permease